MNFDQIINRRATNSAKWTVGPNELPLSIADMDFPTAPAIVAALQAKVATGIFGYETVPVTYYQAVADWYANEHGCRPQIEWMQYASGVIPALASVIRRVTNPGDQVLLQAPVYNMFFQTIRDNGRQVVSSDLNYDPTTQSYSIDWRDLETKLADQRTRLLILCNPHNPTGQIWSQADLVRLAELSGKYHVKIFADEIHGDITFNETGYVPFFSLPTSLLQQVIVAVSPSKTFNVASIHAAILLIPNADLRAVIRQGLQNDGLTAVNLAAIPATIAAYTQGQAWLHELLAYLKTNRAWVEQLIATQLASQIQVVPAQATYLAWLDCRQVTRDTQPLAEFLRQTTGLILTPGAVYGEPGKAFLRLNLAYPRAVLEDGLARLVQGVAAYQEKSRN